MFVELGVGLSVLFNILAVELTGISAGGVIVPGYLAMYLDQPFRLIATFAAAVITLVAVALLGRVVVLYGRRRFTAMLLVGFLVNAGTSELLSFAVSTGAFTDGGLPDLRAVGYLVPGLIANEMSKQGIATTMAMTIICTVLIRIVLDLVSRGMVGALA